MKTRTKYALGWVEVKPQTITPEVAVHEPTVHLYSIEREQVFTFDNRTKAQGCLDFLRERFPNALPKEVEVVEVEMFTE